MQSRSETDQDVIWSHHGDSFAQLGSHGITLALLARACAALHAHGRADQAREVCQLQPLSDVGYSLRPGVAATVYLAYTLDNNFKDEVIIPVGAHAQSMPGPDKLSQSFETSEPLPARSAWNVLKPCMTRPQTMESIETEGNPRVYLKGINTKI